MPEFLKVIVDFVLGIPKAVFGDELLNSAWGIVAATMVTVTAIIYGIGAVRSVWEFIRAVDAGFDKQKLAQYNAKMQEEDILSGRPYADPIVIDWIKARKMQARTFTFVYPLGAFALATMYMWIRYDFTFMGYVRWALVWLVVMLVVIRPWWIWTLRRTHRILVKSGEAKPEDAMLHDKSVLWALRHYFAWGLQEKTGRRRTFFRFLKWAEPIAAVFRLRWLRLRLALPILQLLFYSAVWFIAGPSAVFNLLHQLDDRRHALKPVWAPSGALEPSYSRSIGDTPGDAAAAKG